MALPSPPQKSANGVLLCPLPGWAEGSAPERDHIGPLVEGGRSTEAAAGERERCAEESLQNIDAAGRVQAGQCWPEASAGVARSSGARPGLRPAASRPLRSALQRGLHPAPPRHHPSSSFSSG